MFEIFKDEEISIDFSDEDDLLRVLNAFMEDSNNPNSVNSSIPSASSISLANSLSSAPSAPSATSISSELIPYVPNKLNSSMEQPISNILTIEGNSNLSLLGLE